MRHSRLSGSLRTLSGKVLLFCLCSIPSFAQAPAQAPTSELPPQQAHGLAGDPVAQRIDAILARDEVARGFWGVEIEELDGGRIVYSHNADRLFAPASNAKVFVTSAALALIGTGYRMQTTVEAAAPPDKSGRISGDLVLVGRGDPNLSGRALPFKTKTERPFPPAQAIEELADQVVSRGVKIVDGNVIGDDSFFADEPYGQGWSQQDVVSMWGAPVSALAINDDVIFLSVTPAERAGERAAFTLSPYADYYRIENRVLTTQGGARRISVRRRPGGRRLELRGTIPLNDSGYGEALAVDDPAEWSAVLLRDALRRRGVAIYGKARARHQEAEEKSDSVTAAAPPTGGKPPQPAILAQHLSLPLGEDIRVINKVSQNLHAEMLLRLLGHEKGGSGSVDAGLQVLRDFLNLAGILPEEYALYDGCGLSRHDLASPRALVRLLRYSARQTWGPVFIDSLPLAGVDGTMSSRLQGMPPDANLRAKTGQLEHVNVLSGYVTSVAGHRLVFSILSNNHTLSGKRADEIIDEIVTEAQRARN